MHWCPLRIVVAAVLLAALASVSAQAQALKVGQTAPELVAGRWINSEPLDMRGLRGRVVAVEFWMYG
jgi:hypothetical protein